MKRRELAGMMLFSWAGFAALSAALNSLAVGLDSPAWPAERCQAKWADANLVTQWRWGSWCMVYRNAAWVADADVQFRPSSKGDAIAAN
jgi:hypothetical protein